MCHRSYGTTVSIYILVYFFNDALSDTKVVYKMTKLQERLLWHYCVYNHFISNVSNEELTIHQNFIFNFSFDFRLPPRCWWDLWSSGIATSCGNCLQTFRDNVSVPSLPETSVNNYHTTQRCWWDLWSSGIAASRGNCLQTFRDNVSLPSLPETSDCGFESCRGHGYLSLENVVCCHVESLRRADHTSRGVLPSVVCLKCDREASIMWRPWPTRGCYAIGRRIVIVWCNAS
jgi:hypothetical protein